MRERTGSRRPPFARANARSAAASAPPPPLSTQLTRKQVPEAGGQQWPAFDESSTAMHFETPKGTVKPATFLPECELWDRIGYNYPYAP